MTGNEYQQEALRTAGTMDKERLLVNGVMGLNGEAGECIDDVKKHIFQGHKLDKQHMSEELGDVCWYVAVTAYALDIDLDAVLQMNVDKLRKRYPNGFEAARSVNREDEK